MNIDRYKQDFDSLVQKGKLLHFAMKYECSSKQHRSDLKRRLGDESDKLMENLPSFLDDYQSWYSEAIALIRQLMPDRLSDFTKYYEKPRSRKDITYENYTIEDYLDGLRVTSMYDEVVGPDAAIPRFRQQLSLVTSIGERFRSSLFEIRQLAQADLFDSELDAARELARSKFNRAAGVIAGVVLERHLKEVCGNRSIRLRKKAPTISDLNDSLKAAGVIDVPQWRFIQHLGDLRNLCAHHKSSEPTPDQVENLLAGAAKVTKTIF